MAKTANRIFLSGEAEYIQKLAGGVVSPGHLVMNDSANKFNVQTPVTVEAAKIFAIEDAFQGKTVTDDYAAADQLFAIQPYPGSKVQCVLATGVTVALGAALYSAGDGTLTPTIGTAINAIGFAEEAVTTATAGEFCQIRIA